MSNKCNICKETISRERVTCYGICDGQFHPRCVNLNTIAMKVITENDSIKFVCKECENISSKIIIKKINELLIKVDGDGEKNCNEIITKIAVDVVDIKSVVKNSESEINSIKNNTVKTSYADKVKCTPNEPVVLVVPKEKQNSDITRAEMKERIDPKSIPIENIRSGAKGTIVLEGKNTEDVNKIKEYAKEKMGEKYDVKVTELKRPKIVISGMGEDLDKDEIIKCLRAQNNYLENAHLLVVNKYSYRIKNNRQKFSVIVEIDGDNFKKVLEQEKVNIDWDRCFVKEFLAVKRCFKCCGYNHKAQDCKKKKTCKRCAGEHDVIECKSEHEKCTNCINANNNLKLNLDINHMASALDCVVYRRKLDAERKRVNYSIEQ